MIVTFFRNRQIPEIIFAELPHYKRRKRSVDKLLIDEIINYACLSKENRPRKNQRTCREQSRKTQRRKSSQTRSERRLRFESRPGTRPAVLQQPDWRLRKSSLSPISLLGRSGLQISLKIKLRSEAKAKFFSFVRSEAKRTIFQNCEKLRNCEKNF